MTHFLIRSAATALAMSLALSAMPASAQQNQEEALRRAQMQLRQSEQERNTLRTELAGLQQRLAEQSAQLERLESEMGEAKAQAAGAQDARRKNRETESQLDSTRVELTHLEERAAKQERALRNLRTLFQDNLRKAELQDELMQLCRTRNEELYAIGSDLVTRYGQTQQHVDPVFQLGKVRMLNLLQDFEDRLRDQRVHPDTLPPSLEQQMRESLDAAKAQPAADSQP